MSPFDIAIVNFNTRDLLRSCLESIRSEQPEQVIVVDNASTDESAAMVKAEFPAALLLENSANNGFCAAANQAICASAARYVLLLNSDTRLSPGTLAVLENYLDQHPGVAIVGPRLANPDGSLQRSTFPFPTPLDVFLDASNLSRLARFVPRLKDEYVRTWPHDRARPVPWVMGAAFAIRREAFDQIGGFDQSYFMYYEEVDLCFRLIQHGWEIHYLPEASIVHVGGASTRQYQAQMILQLYRSLAHFYRQHYSPGRLARMVALVRTIALLRLVRDRIRFWLANSAGQKTFLANNLTAWSCLRSTHWERPAAHE